jgi:hypothetical protein
MTTEVNLIELRSRQPGFDEIAWVMRARSTDETQIALAMPSTLLLFLLCSNRRGISRAPQQITNLGKNA